MGINPAFSLYHSTWDGILHSQQSLSLAYTYHQAFIGNSNHEASFQGIFEQPIVPGFRINLRSGAVWNSSDDPLHEEDPQRSGVDILPKRFSARHYAGLSGGLEKHIFTTRMLTLSVHGSWQTVFSYGPISGLRFDHGPSAGLRLYFNRVAMPPFSCGVAYNMQSGRYQMAINIGIVY